MTTYHEDLFHQQHRNLEEEFWGIIRQYSPSFLLKPKLSRNGNKWCAVYGENPQKEVAGFGDSPADAYRDFDKKQEEKRNQIYNSLEKKTNITELYFSPKDPTLVELTVPLECPCCGGHVALDETFIEQVSDGVVCPYCNTWVRVNPEIIGED